MLRLGAPQSLGTHAVDPPHAPPARRRAGRGGIARDLADCSTPGVPVASADLGAFFVPAGVEKEQLARAKVGVRQGHRQGRDLGRGMPFDKSITNGIGIGFIVFCILRVAAGRWREVPVALYVVASVFAFYYLMPALGIGQ